MTILKKSQHEIFAQEIAKGATAQDAYLKAYPNASKDTARKNGSRLLTNADIKRRIDDLKQKTAEECGITLKYLTDKLKTLAEKSEDKNNVPGFNVARNAYMDIAKLNGMIVEKTENQTTHIIDISSEPISEDDWEKQHTD